MSNLEADEVHGAEETEATKKLSGLMNLDFCCNR